MKKNNHSQGTLVSHKYVTFDTTGSSLAPTSKTLLVGIITGQKIGIEVGVYFPKLERSLYLFPWEFTVIEEE